MADLGRRLRLGDAYAFILCKAGDPLSAIHASVTSHADEDRQTALQREQEEALSHLSSVFDGRG